MFYVTANWTSLRWNLTLLLQPRSQGSFRYGGIIFIATDFGRHILMFDILIA